MKPGKEARERVLGAEEREHRRYSRTAAAYSEAAIKTENSLGLLNIVQASILNVMMGFGMATSAIGDQSQSSLGFLASGGSWSELTLGEKFAAGAEASFLAAIVYALASYAD